MNKYKKKKNKRHWNICEEDTHFNQYNAITNNILYEEIAYV